MRALATAIASAVMALGAFGLAVAAPHAGGGDAPRAALAAASGAVQIANSREGEALFAAGAMRPGQAVSGSVRIANAGTSAGSFSVRLTGVQDTPGPYGGRLSDRVQLALVDETDAARPVTVYAGTAAGFGAIDLGTIEAGAQRGYRLAAALPAASGDNHFQGAALSLGLEWRASASGGALVPTPSPAPTVPPPATGASGDVLAGALELPPTRACAKRRWLKLRLKAPRGLRMRSATVSVGGKLKARVMGAKKRMRMKSRGLPAGRVTVVVRVRASNGRSYTSKRRVSTCKPKR